MNLKLAIGILAIATMAVPRIAVTQENTDDSTDTVTGCLEKSSTANTYMLTDENTRCGIFAARPFHLVHTWGTQSP
jgi:hypothetical protein